ncbi:hypothetical protein An11g02280 [Aspergillus niger]|uniref:Uncharacterized protein n=2 Tax=Aspergillus niger TaxID=5061 RepID=A2QVQ5_ASPNC|nr:hypothetical protein An11g02280 [Aspergillus niger]CAK40587.1 hypothetical protein An11g02280 [Aspergillus niger]
MECGMAQQRSIRGRSIDRSRFRKRILHTSSTTYPRETRPKTTNGRGMSEGGKKEGKKSKGNMGEENLSLAGRVDERASEKSDGGTYRGRGTVVDQPWGMASHIGTKYETGIEEQLLLVEVLRSKAGTSTKPSRASYTSVNAVHPPALQPDEA